MRLHKRVTANLRYAIELRSFLRHTVTAEEARAIFRQRLARRTESFLDLLDRGVYANRRSPYRRLLQHAGIEASDVRELAQDHGLEGMLDKLYEAGVYVTMEEFKGRQPIRRGSLEFSASTEDFANPFLAGHYETQTSGSRGAPARAMVDLEYAANEALYILPLLEAHAIAGRPAGVWNASGPTFSLILARINRMPERCFTSVDRGTRGFRHIVFTDYTHFASGLFGRAIPRLEYVSRDEVLKVVEWLAEKTSQGTPAYLTCLTSPAVRICLAAKQHGLDISGTVFRVGGEPYTPAKAEVIESVGARVIVSYIMTEMGAIGHACAAPIDLDDVHVCTDKLALIQRRTITSAGTPVEALVYTSLLSSGPRLMLNVESGDYGSLVQRHCGCALGDLGFTSHISGIGSYEKLTSEGVTFIGGQLYKLIEEVLPARFGGTSLDYQVVEEEEEGLPRVSIVVAPGVGDVDEAALVTIVLTTLQAGLGGGRTMASEWRQGQTLRVVRREPYETRSAKVLPLHVLRASARETGREDR